MLYHDSSFSYFEKARLWHPLLVINRIPPCRPTFGNQPISPSFRGLRKRDKNDSGTWMFLNHRYGNLTPTISCSVLRPLYVFEGRLLMVWMATLKSRGRDGFRNKNPAKFDMDKLKRCHNLQKGT